MSSGTSQVVRGYVSAFSIRKVFDEGIARFDVEVCLSREPREGSGKTVVRFTDATKVGYGGGREDIDFGACVSLAIEDVSDSGGDGIGFRARDLEGSGLSLFCRRFDVEEVAMVLLPDHCAVLF